MAFCNVTLQGNLGKDAEQVELGGVSALKFSVAVSRGGYTRKDGTAVPESTAWYRVTLFRPSDYQVQSLRKGARVLVTGSLNAREYDAQGVKRTSLDVEASAKDVHPLDKPAEAPKKPVEVQIFPSRDNAPQDEPLPF